MTKVTATDARNRWFEILKNSVRGHRTYQIASKEGGAVLLSQEDYDSLIETLALLSTPGFRTSIRQARKEIKAGKTYSMQDVFGE